MFAAKAFTIASLILAGAKAFEVSTPIGVSQVRMPLVFSGLGSSSSSAVILRSLPLVQLAHTTSQVSDISDPNQNVSRSPVSHLGTFVSDAPVLIPPIPQFAVIPAANPCDADALFESDALTDGSFTWKANLPAGTEVVVFVDDEQGNDAWSASVSPSDDL